MCVYPVDLPNGVEVGCRKCWQCRADRVNDYVGRCLCEAETAADTLAVTLTYNEDAGAHAVHLVYSDVQKFLKRLRKDFDVRYIVCGEYGAEKGRAHWHAVLFFKWQGPERVEHTDDCKGPQVKVSGSGRTATKWRFAWKYWPHGVVVVQEADEAGLRYALKYVLKGQEDGDQSHLAMSKKPPLGAEFLTRWADDVAEQGLAPQNGVYRLRSCLDPKTGKPRKFALMGVTRANFVAAWRAAWVRHWGDRPEPSSEWVEAALDRVARAEMRAEGVEPRPDLFIAKS